MFDGIKLQGTSTNTPSEMLGKLLEKLDIELKTDLNINQIKVLFTLKYHVIMLMNPNINPIDALDQSLTYLMELMVSNKRLGRSEIITAVKNMEQPLQPQNIQGMLGK